MSIITIKCVLVQTLLLHWVFFTMKKVLDGGLQWILVPTPLDCDITQIEATDWPVWVSAQGHALQMDLHCSFTNNCSTGYRTGNMAASPVFPVATGATATKNGKLDPPIKAFISGDLKPRNAESCHSNTPDQWGPSARPLCFWPLKLPHFFNLSPSVSMTTLGLLSAFLTWSPSPGHYLKDCLTSSSSSSAFSQVVHWFWCVYTLRTQCSCSRQTDFHWFHQGN